MARAYAAKKEPVHPLVRLVPVILCLAFLAAPVRGSGSETRIQPGITVSEEYNDNIFLLPADKVDDYVTRFDPSVALDRTASLWDFNVRYVYDYRRYAHYSDGNGSSHTVHAVNTTRLKGNSLLLDVSDDYQKISLDPRRDYGQESIFINQTDRNILNVNPHGILRPSTQTTIHAGYSLIDTRYKQRTGVDTTEHVFYTEADNEASDHISLSAGARYSQNENRADSFSQEEVFFGPAFGYAEKSKISFRVAYLRFSFDQEGVIQKAQWQSAFVHTFADYTASVDAGIHYIPDPERVLIREDRYQAAVSRVTERISYSVAGGFREYRRPGNDVFDSKNYSLALNAGYGFTEKTLIRFSLLEERVKNSNAASRVSRYFSTVRFERNPLEHLTWALQYRFSEAESPSVQTQKYTNNRFLFEITYQF